MPRIRYSILVPGQKQDQLEYWPEIPETLLLDHTNSSQAQVQARQRFLQSNTAKYVQPEMDKGVWNCVICGKRAKIFKDSRQWTLDSIIQTVLPVCSPGPCELQANCLKDRAMEGMMQAARRLPGGENMPVVFDTRSCLVCGKHGQVKVCSRCKRASYCGAHCQKSNWPTHKRYCRAK